MRQAGSRRRAGAVVAGGGLLLSALLSACGTGVAPRQGPASAQLSAAASPAAPQTSPGAAGGATAAPTPAVRQIRLTVAGSKVTGDTGLVDLRVGEPARVTVTSDVADEVHVHSQGEGFGKDVAAGGTVTIDFVETAPGRFEVELEKAKRTLTRLQVR